MLSRARKSFTRDQDGIILVEGLLVLPVLTLLTFGILEFGNMMWQRQQLQVGIRDAARYWSRCRETINAQTTSCDEFTARNIAFFGNPSGTGNLRVPGWGPNDDDAELTISPAKTDFPGTPTSADLVTVTGSFVYLGSPVYDALLDDLITVSWSTQMRYMGW